MRSQYTPVLFPDNMDLSIFNAIRTDELAGARSSLLAGLCWASCRRSHPTSMFWQCSYSSLSTGKDCKLQLGCSQLQPGLAGCLPSPWWILPLLLPTSEVKLCFKSTLSCWSAENYPGRKSTTSGARRYLALANLQKQHIFLPPGICWTLCQVSLLCRKRAVPVPVPGPQHSWWCGQPEHRAHGAVADRVTAPGGAQLHPLCQLPLCWHRITMGLAQTLQLHGPPVLILPEFVLACSVTQTSIFSWRGGRWKRRKRDGCLGLILRVFFCHCKTEPL